MQENSGEKWRGLPIPNATETECVELFLDDRHGDQIFTYHDVALQVSMISPHIGSVIKHDLDQFSEYESGQYDSEQIIEFCEGIKLGYNFGIGAVTYLHFLRSIEPTMDEYLSVAANIIGNIPVLTKDELARVKAVRSCASEILVERCINMTPVGKHDEQESDEVSSSDLAYVHTGNYLTQVPVLYEALASEMDFWLGEQGNEPNGTRWDNDELDECFSHGIEHGFGNCIEMYVQSYEQEVLRFLDYNPEI